MLWIFIRMLSVFSYVGIGMGRWRRCGNYKTMQVLRARARGSPTKEKPGPAQLAADLPRVRNQQWKACSKTCNILKEAVHDLSESLRRLAVNFEKTPPFLVHSSQLGAVVHFARSLSLSGRCCVSRCWACCWCCRPVGRAVAAADAGFDARRGCLVD